MRSHLVPLVLSAFLIPACGGSAATEPVEPTSTSAPTPPEGEPAAEAEPAAASPAASEQIARGGELYGANCAGCHGNAGQGTDKAPMLVGSGALPREPRQGAKRDVTFSTALDVFTWVKGHMPPKAPGSLADDEYVAILAFALKANGVALEQPLDGARAAEINLQ